MPLRKRRRDFGWLMIVCAGLLPLVLGILCIAINARHSVTQQQRATANILLAQAEKMSDSAWSMIAELRKDRSGSCGETETKLQRIVALNAYFRSVGTLQGEYITCSSVSNIGQPKLAEIIRQPLPVTGTDRWSLSLPHTAGVSQRPAVIFVDQLPDSSGFWALIDGQYLIDFMRAMGESRGYQISLQFGNGAIISSSSNKIPDGHYMQSEHYQHESLRYPVRVSITVPAAEVIAAWRQALFVFLPMAAIFSIMLMILTANWLRRRISWADEIRRALRNRQFFVHYQPVYSNDIARCSGAEALLRWQLPNGEMVRPDIFIAHAETEGVIVELTRHLLELMAEDIMHWPAMPGFHIGFNLAAEHLQHDDFIDDIMHFAHAVRDKQLLITLELTERSLIQDGESVAHKLRYLQSQGMKVAIDDFGTGHCSLSYLMTFPLDYLKIDRGFINAIEGVDIETPVLDTIITLCQKLRLDVLGEGVETALQFTYLQQHQVRFIQGYYYALPMSSAHFLGWMRKQGDKPLAGMMLPTLPQ